MRNKVLYSILVLAIVLAIAVQLSIRQAPPPASQAFVNAVVLTMNPEDEVAQAVLIERDRIVAVGSDAQIRARMGPETEAHDLLGKTLIPGFIDAHGHFPGSRLVTRAVDLNSPPIGKIENIDQVVSALREKVKGTLPGRWIYGIAYDDTLLAENRHLTRHDLDRASTEHPILATHISGHLFVANSKALEVAGKYADLVVLSENPITAPERIREIEVERTLVGGRTIYSSDSRQRTQ